MRPAPTVQAVQACGKLQFFELVVRSETDPAKTYVVSCVDGALACTCPAWKHRPQLDERGQRWCKHLRRHFPRFCFYHELVDGPPRLPGTCPTCGGPTVYVHVAL